MLLYTIKFLLQNEKSDLGDLTGLVHNIDVETFEFLPQFYTTKL